MQIRLRFGHGGGQGGEGDLPPGGRVPDPPGEQFQVLQGVDEEHQGGPADDPLPELLAGLDQGVAVGVGRPAGRGGAGGEGPVRVGLDELDGGVFLAEDLACDLEEGGGVSLSHVGDAAVEQDPAVRGELDLGDRRVGEPAAVAHGVEHGGHADAPLLEGARLGDPLSPFPPEGMASDRLEARGDPRGLGHRHAGAVPVPLPEGVLQAQLQGVQVQFPRQEVHHPFEGEAHLGHAEAAHGAGDGIVRVDAPAFDQGMGDRGRGRRHAPCPGP